MTDQPALLLVFVSLAFAACSPGPDLYEKKTTVAGYDFGDYTERGFLITPEGYEGAYQSIGTLRVTVWPAVERTDASQSGDETLSDPIGEDPVTGPRWRVVEPVDPQEVVDSLYVEAENMGADAILNFRTSVVREQVRTDLTRIGIRAKGFGIQREE